jgi:hypothetical protein
VWRCAELSAQVEALLGPTTEADLTPPEKKKKPKVRICDACVALQLCCVKLYPKG